jgi:hypothetical protein
MRTLIVAALMSLFAGSLWASAPEKTEPGVKYKAGKDLNFEQLVIEGQLKRPELSVVTGDSDENGNGLLRLRENFMDRMAESAGQEAQ